MSTHRGNPRAKADFKPPVDVDTVDVDSATDSAVKTLLANPHRDRNEIEVHNALYFLDAKHEQLEGEPLTNTDYTPYFEGAFSVDVHRVLHDEEFDVVFRTFEPQGTVRHYSHGDRLTQNRYAQFVDDHIEEIPTEDELYGIIDTAARQSDSEKLPLRTTPLSGYVREK